MYGKQDKSNKIGDISPSIADNIAGSKPNKTPIDEPGILKRKKINLSSRFGLEQPIFIFFFKMTLKLYFSHSELFLALT